MAIWQFDLHAVHWDTGRSLPALESNFARAWLEKELEPAASVMPGWLVFGHVESNRIDLVEDSAGVCELNIRIDARTEADSFIQSVVLLLLGLKCALYAPELERFVPVEVSAVREALQASAAWRYSLDPISALRAR